MSTIEAVGEARGDEVLALVGQRLDAVATDQDFRARLLGPIYDENSEVTRFILSTLAEDAMTKETKVDLAAEEQPIRMDD